MLYLLFFIFFRHFSNSSDFCVCLAALLWFLLLQNFKARNVNFVKEIKVQKLLYFDCIQFSPPFIFIVSNLFSKNVK